MKTDPDLSPMAWAASLTRRELAHQLRRLAADKHVLDAAERRAVCTIAADNLEQSERVASRFDPGYVPETPSVTLTGVEKNLSTGVDSCEVT